MGNIYKGQRTVGRRVVTVDGEPLSPNTDLLENVGFDWGCEGLGATQLASALLAHHLGNAAAASELSPRFERAVVSNLGGEWQLTSADLEAAVQSLGGVRARSFNEVMRMTLPLRVWGF
jgi:hypothetical protein